MIVKIMGAIDIAGAVIIFFSTHWTPALGIALILGIKGVFSVLS